MTMNSARSTSGDPPQAHDEAVWQAWLRKNREKEALTAAKWTKVALFASITALVSAIFWYGWH